MAIVKMQKLSVLIHQDYLDSSLEVMQKFGNFEITDIIKDQAKNNNFVPEDFISHDVDVRLAELDFAIRLLSPFNDSKKSLREKVIGDKIFAEVEEVEQSINKEDIPAIIKRCSLSEEELNRHKSALVKIAEEESMLDNWKNLNFGLNFARSTDHAEMRIGQISSRDFADFSHRLTNNPLVHLQVINENNTFTFMFLVFHKELKMEVQKLLDLFKFSEAIFSESEVKPKDRLAVLKHDKEEVKTKIEAVNKNLKDLSANLPLLKSVYEHYYWEKDKVDAKQKTFKSAKTVLLEGWVPANKVDVLKNDLNSISPYFHLNEMDSGDVDNYPVSLNNNALFAPFEIVTNIFGLPKKTEIDPSPILAPFFALFFGFCLTDAGYGIILTISMLILYRLPFDQGTKKMFKLLLMCGISTIIMGILFGGWVGLLPEQVPAFLTKEVEGGKMLFIGQVFDPMTDLTDKIMPIAFGLGFFQLLIGLFLAGYIKIINGKKGEAYQTSFLLGLFIIIGAIYALSGILGIDKASVEILRYTFYIILIMLFWGLGYGTQNPILRILSGGLSIINQAMSWLSNVLSYSRLFALGLATGIVATIFNDLAMTFGTLIIGDFQEASIFSIFFGLFIGLFVLLFGHIMNIGLNLLGAFIHSGRLQFVEFFGQFAEFGGKAFKPFSRRSRYVFNDKI